MKGKEDRGWEGKKERKKIRKRRKYRQEKILQKKKRKEKELDGNSVLKMMTQKYSSN